MQAYQCKDGVNMMSNKAKGGIARATKLSPEQRSEIAKKAAVTRWSDDIPNAICGTPDQPLKIDNIEIQCYVLENETRVLTQTGLQQGIGMSASGGSSIGSHRLTKLIERIASKHLPNIPELDSLSSRIQNPIKFKLPNGGTAYGYEATILADICDAILAARKAKLLQPQQSHIPDRCETLLRGFARVGIIALVDEATGYQDLRAKNALSRILEAFIAKELQPYVQTFPADYYKETFRLRGLQYPNDSVRRPQYFGILTNDVIYKRLAPGVLKELKNVTLRDDVGRARHKYFQRLTSNIGYPKLRELLGAVVAIMKLSNNWHDFVNKLDTQYPRYGDTIPLPLVYDGEKDDGKGL
jgi:hypothetical protein